MSKDALPERRKNRIEDFDYATAGAYFVTVCTAEREKIFWLPVGADTIRPKSLPLSASGKIVEQSILQIEQHYEGVTVDKYCVMPDHIHMLISVRTEEGGRILSAPTLPTVVGSMKRWVSKQIGRPVWQKSFYDHGIRNQQDYDETWKYIENNPLKYLLKREP